MDLVKDYLNHIEMFPDDEELERIKNLAVKQYDWEQNKGYRHSRIEHNPREKAFYEQWLHENKPQAGIGSGYGILQDLFIESTLSPLSGKTIEIITPRDRMIVATVIQWLGSNVGISFLGAALKRFDAYIAHTEKAEPVSPQAVDLYYLDRADYNDEYLIKNSIHRYTAGYDKEKVIDLIHRLNKAHRPNIKQTARSKISVCWNDHEKHEDCNYVEEI